MQQISLTTNIDKMILNDNIKNGVCAIIQKNLGHSMSRVQNFKLAWRHFHGINCYKGISSLFVTFIQLLLSAPSKRVLQFSEHSIERLGFKFWLIQWLQKKMKTSFSIMIKEITYIFIFISYKKNKLGNKIFLKNYNLTKKSSKMRFITFIISVLKFPKLEYLFI